ncbi:MAG: CYTH domain-containing protein [Actinomycetaceae bacterium]|nr:CYTH domain-containing protein [Actinomycetaceae bacterium]
MGKEVERKFLIQGDQWRQSVTHSEALSQGYLASSPTCLVRVRTGSDCGWVTIKGATSLTQTPQGQSLVRAEYEWQISLDQAQQMLSTLALTTVSKVRHFLDCAPGAWTVDEFEGENAPLLLLEIEHEDAANLRREDLPSWVGEEVSADNRYSNAALSQHPYSSWAPLTGE